MIVKIAKNTVDFDIDRIVSMLLELDKIHHSAAPERFPLFSFEERKRDIEKFVDQGSIFYAEINLQILGFASVVQKSHRRWIEHLYVDPGFRLRKVATGICKTIFENFPDEEVFASVYAFNREAIFFYEKLFNLSSLIFKK